MIAADGRLLLGLQLNELEILADTLLIEQLFNHMPRFHVVWLVERKTEKVIIGWSYNWWGFYWLTRRKG